MLVSRDGWVPLLARLYRGNHNDVSTFPEGLKAIRQQCKELSILPERVTLVMDKGNISNKNWRLLDESGFGYVTSLPPGQYADCSTRSLDEFSSCLVPDVGQMKCLGTRAKVAGKERHVPYQETGSGGYPMRAIRTHDFLYIRNFKPDRRPAGHAKGYAQPTNIVVSRPLGTMYGYGDVDASPTKSYMLKYRNEPQVAGLFTLAFGKRPAEELYDLRKDPSQLNNVAGEPEYTKIKRKLAAALMAELKATKDPRVLGRGDLFDKYPYYGGGLKNISQKPSKTKR